jgi:hypothetical protein
MSFMGRTHARAAEELEISRKTILNKIRLQAKFSGKCQKMY